MEPKNRLMIVIAVTILILGAIFASFGRSIFTLDTPEVILPSGDTAPGSPSGEQDALSDQDFLQVEITPSTVQNVIETLDRTDSFYRELTVESVWGEVSSSVKIQNWTDGGWSHSRLVLPSGAVRHDLVGDHALYYWYEGGRKWLSAPADEFSGDLSQRTPTYETVLNLDPEDITSAGYDMSGDYPCVFAEVQSKEQSLLTRFWVSVDSGLLVAAEQLQDGQLTYRMTSHGVVQSPCPAGASFALPNGTVLHEIN